MRSRFVVGWMAWLALLLAGCSVAGAPQPARPTQVIVTPSAGQQTALPVIAEQRQIVIEWPATIREKDSDWVLLSVKMDLSGQRTVTAENSAHELKQVPVEIPNLYETHNVVAVARLDMAGLDAWREPLREPMRPGRDVTFRWSVRPEQAGIYRGVLWLSLEFVPKDGGPIDSMTLLSRPLTIQSVSIFGLPGWVGRLVGGAGVFISTILGLPLVQPWLASAKKRRQHAKLRKL